MDNMKINLRKASHLERDIQTLITDLSDQLESRIEVDQYSDPDVRLLEASKLFEDAFDKILFLREIAFTIRQRVAALNAECGITDLLADKAKFEQNLRMFVRYSKVRPMMDISELKRRLEDFKSNDSFRDDTIYTTFFTNTRLDKFKADVSSMKKELRSIDATLLEKNIQHKIELSPTDVSFLEKEGLL